MNPTLKTVGITLGAVLLVGGLVWQFFPNWLVNPSLSKNQGTQTQYTDAGKQIILLQMKDAVAAGQTIQIRDLGDPRDGKVYNFDLVAKAPVAATSTPKQ